VQTQFREEQFAKVLQFTASSQCRMSVLVRHFGDVEDASRPCGACDVCDPAGAVLRQFRRASAAERRMAQDIIEDLRRVDYKATGTLQRGIASLAHLDRDGFDALLDAMVRAGLIEMEEAEYEKDGEVRRYRKVRLTGAGLEVRPATPLALLMSDGIVEEFAGEEAVRPAKKKVRPPAASKTDRAHAPEGRPEPLPLSPMAEALAVRLREWRAAEAKRLRVPAYVVMHDRTLLAVAQARPSAANELLQIEGIGPAKVERFGEAILRVCGS
jgi:superfamily II DNA helicase RecQ